MLSLTAIVHAYIQRERMRRGAGLTFPAVRAIVQEIFTTLLFVAKPSYLHWIEQAKNANFNYGSDQVGLEKHLSGLDLMFMAGSITRFFARMPSRSWCPRSGPAISSSSTIWSSTGNLRSARQSLR